MKSKVTMTALAVCTVLGLGYNTMASANITSVDFSTTITVDSPNTCTFTSAVAGGNSSWDLRWALTTAGDPTSSSMVSNSPTDPLFVNVMADIGSAAACTLNKMTFGTDMKTATVAGAGDEENVYRVETANGGFWRYAPVLSKLELFTTNTGADDEDSASLVTLTNITVKDANGASHAQQAVAGPAGKQEGTAFKGFKNQKAMLLTDSFFGSADVPLSKGSSSVALSFIDSTSAIIKSARIGVGVIVASNPEDAQGYVDVDAVNGGESINLPFVINITPV
ncbi:hypothetical protein ACSOQX_003019 [Yersinia enterocolitica]